MLQTQGQSASDEARDLRSHAETESVFRHLKALIQHYQEQLPPHQVEEMVAAEKAVFVIRRESTLEETRLQFLRRLEAVFNAEIHGEPLPDWSEMPSEREFLSNIPRFR